MFAIMFFPKQKSNMNSTSSFLRFCCVLKIAVLILKHNDLQNSLILVNFYNIFFLTFELLFALADPHS